MFFTNVSAGKYALCKYMCGSACSYKRVRDVFTKSTNTFTKFKYALCEHICGITCSCKRVRDVMTKFTNTLTK